jgi:hypothetical protein
VSIYVSNNGRRTLTADRCLYDPTGTGLASQNTQDAISELASLNGAGKDLLTFEFFRLEVIDLLTNQFQIVTDTGILTGLIGEALTL